MQYLTIAFIAFITACSFGADQNNANESIIPDIAAAPRIADEAKFIHIDSAQNAMLQSCEEPATFENRTSYGIWLTLKNCNLQFNGITIKQKDISIHKDNKGRINALKFMVVPSSRYGQYLQNKYKRFVTEKEHNVCIQYFRNTLPLLIIVDEPLCTAISYNQI